MRFLALLICCAFVSLAPAQSVPPLVNYQGQLVDSNGDPLEGMKKLEFNIYGSATGSDLLWGPQVFDNVPLVWGEFNVILSQDTGSRPVTDAFSGSAAYVGIKVGDAGGTVGAEFLPRQQFLSVPYALRSLDADSAGADELEARVAALEDAVFPRGSSRIIRVFAPSTARVRGGGVAIDSTGNIYFSGGKGAGTVDFGGGPLTAAENTAIVLVKLDAAGEHVWSRQFVTRQEFISNILSNHDLAIDAAGNIVFAGGHRDPVDFGGGEVGEADESGLFLAKFDAAGNEIWSRSYPLSNRKPVVGIDPSGDIVIAATLNRTVQIGSDVLENAGRDDIFLGKFSGSDGSPIWARRYGSSQDEYITGLEIGPDGDIYLAGGYELALSIGTIAMPHHGIVSNAYYERLFFARIGNNGLPVWAKGFAPQSASLTHPDRSGGIGLDSHGNVWSSGMFVGARDFGGGATGTGTSSYLTLLSFDEDGNWRLNEFWPAFQREGFDLEMVGDGPLLAGPFSTGSGVNFGGGLLESGFLVLAMEPGSEELSLEHRWSNVTGSANSPLMTGMDYRNGNVAIVGLFTGSVDFGSGAVTPGDETGLFLLVKRY